MRTVSLVMVALLMFPNTVYTSSWLSCPLSFNPNSKRGGELIGPCEVPVEPVAVTQVRAGDRLKVGWPSNNNGGGYVRLSLVPESQFDDASAFEKNVLKLGCFGHDQRSGKFKSGVCVHPCNGRPGCQFQSSVNDNERYDTTISIPFNIPNGLYILQWVALIGNNVRPYYSCAKLSVTGGNVSINCNVPKSINIPTCIKASGPTSSQILPEGSKYGNFCYGSQGSSNIDYNISQKPANANCDPRVSCSLSVSESICKQEITQNFDSNNPFIKSCPIDSTATKTTTMSSTVTSTLTLSSSTFTTRPSTTTLITTVTKSTTKISSTTSATKTTIPTTTATTVIKTTTKITSTTETTTNVPSTSPTKTTNLPTSTPPSPTCPINGQKCNISPDKFFCVGKAIGRCVSNQYVVFNCAPGTKCRIVSGTAICDFDDKKPDAPCLF